MSRRGREATDGLTRALLDMSARGERTHFSDSASKHLWLSEHDGERKVAALLRRHCPVEDVCETQPNNVMNAGAFGAGRTAASDREEGSMTDVITLLRQSEAASKVRTICSGI